MIDKLTGLVKYNTSSEIFGGQSIDIDKITPRIIVSDTNYVNSCIDGNFLYCAIESKIYKKNILTGTQIELFEIVGASDYRCFFKYGDAIYFSPMDSYGNNINISDYGLYKIENDIVSKVINLGSGESIWGFTIANDILFCGVYKLPGFNCNVYKSIDGTNFTLTFTHPTLKHCHAISFDEISSKIYICLGDVYGSEQNYVSSDFGENWSSIVNQPINQFTAVLSNKDYRLFGTDQRPYGRIYKTTNDIDLNIVLDTHYQNVFFLKKSDITGFIYAGFKLDPSANSNYFATINYSRDDGDTWEEIYRVSSLVAGEGFWFCSDFYRGSSVVTGRYNILNATFSPSIKIVECTDYYDINNGYHLENI